MSQGPSNLYGQQISANSISVVPASDSAWTIFNGTLDSGNSSTATLSANATFTGTAFDAFNQGAVLVTAFADTSSVENGFRLQWSSNGTNWDEQLFLTFVAATASGALSVQATERARYFRVVYTNGPVAQTSFRLQAIHRITTPSGDVLELQDEISASNHSQLATSVVAGKSSVDGSVSYIPQNTDKPDKNSIGLFTRNIPSGIQEVSAGEILMELRKIRRGIEILADTEIDY